MSEKKTSAKLLYLCSPLFLYAAVSLASAAAMEAVWGLLFGAGTPSGADLAYSYALQAVWQYLHLVVPAGIACLFLRWDAARELEAFRPLRGRQAGSGQAVPGLAVLLVSAVCLALGINALCALFVPQALPSAELLARTPGIWGFVLQAFVFGLYMPLIEELLFRGILFARMVRLFTPGDAPAGPPGEKRPEISQELRRDRTRERDGRDEKAALSASKAAERAAYGNRKKRAGVLRAAVLSAAVFGIYHGNLLQGLYAFVMGIVFAAAYAKAGRFSVPYGLHGACNLVILLLFWTGAWDRLCTPAWAAAFFAIAAAGLLTLTGAHR